MKAKQLVIAIAATMLLGTAVPAQAQKRVVKQTSRTTATTTFSNDQQTILNALKSTLQKVQGATCARDLFDADNYLRCVFFEVLEKNPNVIQGDSFMKEFGDTYSKIDEALDIKMEQLGIEKRGHLYNFVSCLHGS